MLVMNRSNKKTKRKRRPIGRRFTLAKN